MNSARQGAHVLLDDLSDADVLILERLLESLVALTAHIEQQQLDVAIQAGLNSLAEGRGKNGDKVFDRLLK